MRKPIGIISSIGIMLLGIFSIHKYYQIPNSGIQNQEAQDQSKLYFELSKTLEDKYGYVGGKCDATTFNALRCIYSGVPKEKCPVYQSQSKEIPGLWFRHAEHNCYDRGESKTDNSRDQFLMLALMFWHYKDLKSVEEVISYAERHGYIMGRSKNLAMRFGRSFWSGTFAALYYELSARLGGRDRGAYKRSLQRIATPTTDFESHLQANRILLIGLLTGSINTSELNWLEAQIGKNPKNPLFKFIRARFDNTYPMSQGYKSLLDYSYFPKDKLPNSRENYCTNYLFQRDEIKIGDWQPCPKDKLEIHPGLDFGWAECVAREGCI